LELTATTWFDEICKRGSDGTTQRIRLQKDKFFNQSVLLPEGNEQEELLEKILSFKKGQSSLDSEINNQKELTTQLKQSILQEAIQGKLTEEWRKQNIDTEPASELLKRIKAEKAQLIKDKKIRKEKPLPPITEEEIPFDLPEGWVWCRIPQILALTKDPLRRGPFGSSLKKNMFEPSSIETTKIYEQQNAIKKDYTLGNYFISTKKYPNLKSFLAGPGDILISCAGTIGETYKLPHEAPIGIINQALLKIRLNQNAILDDFFIMMFKSQLQGQVNSDAKGTAMKNMGSVKYLQHELFFGLPPIDEQRIIIQKVNALLEKCDVMESEITQSEQHAQMLMQAVLKEAFESKKEEVYES
jgi:type I restriction enzyme S subunit